MVSRIAETSTTNLYEEDYLLWIETTLKQLQEQDTENLDWQNLIDYLPN
jgi:hypothetical protein